MRVIWKFESEPEFATLSRGAAKELLHEASESKAVRQASLLGLLSCSLFVGVGTLIDDAFTLGNYGAAVWGAVGGLIYSQVRARAILRWIRERNASLQTA